ncbi:two-partner secretion domain-containing protein [Yersinia rohdei]|uniref:two-partner secretion domain-containing protein n=1 Tax=Yersinia rohdei TaxID=29485 RepID=UPI0011A3C117|nr:filamentous hemagglutinin N-terminal domain-containing protein [Yersinia rohdei]
MTLNSGNKRRVLSVLSFSIILSFYGVSATHAASIIADKSAPNHQQADIKIKPPGLPVPCRIIGGCGEMTTINIQAPDKNGLSHNKYTQFDTPHFHDVVTLNNALSREVNGNPHLQGMAAKIILNEVNADKASILNGKVMLAGQDAHVIIANPSGIECNGCSFTNVSHLTLTSGTPHFSNNKLQKFRVIEGNINVNEGRITSGLTHQGRADTPAYLDLFANKINVNGKLNADDVFLVAGKNDIALSSPGQKINISSLVARADMPTLSDNIDISEMGGMYANKIRIVAEGNINNSGRINSKGLLLMVAGGDIYNTDTYIHGKHVRLVSAGTTHNIVSAIYGTERVRIEAKELINNDGFIVSDKRINIRSDNPVGSINGGEIRLMGKQNKEQQSGGIGRSA